MKVLQLIDSLNPGGAERMAVNLANALVDKTDKSFLCCSREEGRLKTNLTNYVQYFFLSKKSSFDFRAIFRLRKIIKTNKIDVVHAHGSSYFLATLIKISGLRFKLVWHDHYGGRTNTSGRYFFVLYFFSIFFDQIIMVNDDLKIWAEKALLCSRIKVLSNFVICKNKNIQELVRRNDDSFKIVCTANLKPPKNHLNLLRGFKQFSDKKKVKTSLLLIGQDYNDHYSTELKNYIMTNNLSEQVSIINNIIDVSEILGSADIGILSSDSEGLPMAILEYGLAKLPVICTDVGGCKALLGDNGVIIEKGDSQALAFGLDYYYYNENRRIQDGLNFYKTVQKNFSTEVVIMQYIETYVSLIANDDVQ